MGFHLNPKKSIFTVIKGKLLGHIISKEGITIDPEVSKIYLSVTFTAQ
jgi:hypothetical protein